MKLGQNFVKYFVHFLGNGVSRDLLTFSVGNLTPTKNSPRTCTKTMGLPIPVPPVMLSKVETDHFSTYTQYVKVD